MKKLDQPGPTKSESPARQTRARKRFAANFLVTLSAVLIMSGLLFFSTSCGRNLNQAETQSPEATTQAEAYKSKLELSQIGLATGENYLGDKVYYVEGTANNTGDKIVQRIDLTFLFKDSLNQVVLKETRRVVDYKLGKGLEPQKTTRFQVGFERLPKDWNYVVPEVRVTNVILK